jgi:polysaccharide chain length determinant protein (PEP-CTERM system associated)
MDVMRNSESATDLSYLMDMGQELSSGRDTRLDARYFLNLLLRFRWVLIAPFCLAMLVGIYLAATLPRMYRSESTILVEPQSVPDKYVHATVPLEIDARIASLAQQILSGSNLMELIDRFKLFSNADSQNMVIEEKVEKMRSLLRVRIADEELGKGKRAGSRASAFTISYEDSDPRKVFQVVNSMATFVIDQNLKMRESQAFGTSDFLQDELTKMRARLEEVEKALEEYRRVHMGELPEQLPSNLTILERLQQQLNQSHQSVRDDKNRLLIVESQLKFAQQASNPSLGATLPGPDGGPKSLEGLRQQLVEYETKYTGNHPDVVALKKKIEALEKELAEGGKTPAPQTVKAAPASTGNRPFMEAELLGQQQALMRNIQAVEAGIAKIQAQIEQYQTRVENTPKREQELLLLKRDYDNIKSTYSSVLNRKLEADMSLNMEKKQKGEQFRILDPPRMAEKPISPNLKMILMACIAGGLGIGCGIIFLCEFFDNSVRKPEALQARLSLPVLMVMPAMEHMRTRRSRVLGWLNHGLSAAGALACLGLLACLTAVTVFNLSPSEVIRGVFH